MIDCQATCDACTLLEADGGWRVQLHSISESLDRLKPEWDRLLPESDANQFFMLHAWQHLWWRHFGADYLLRMITIRDHSGRLVGIAPLMTPRLAPDSTLAFIGGTEVADYLDMIVERGHAQVLRRALLVAIRDHLQWSTLDLHCLREQSSTPEVVQALFQGTDCQVAVELEDVSPFVQLHGTWDAYLASLNKKDRHELRRKLRRAVDDQSAAWVQVQSHADLDARMDAFIGLHRASSPDKAAFMTAAMEAYFRELAIISLENGWLRLGVLLVSDTPVSSAIGFAYNGVLYLYNSGYDPAYHSSSVGIASVGMLMRDSANEGLHTFDFLQGNESYKYTLGAIDTNVYRVICSREHSA